MFSSIGKNSRPFQLETRIETLIANRLAQMAKAIPDHSN